MIRQGIWMALLGLACFREATVSAADAPTRPYQVDVSTDIAYRSDDAADPIKHKLDIYTPRGVKDFPVLMFVHGGAWKSGNKAMYASLGATFARQGIGAVIINYRLTGGKNSVRHPEHIKDVASAFAWVHDHIAEHGGRPDRIFISGHSAGAHLVSLLATDESYLKEHKRSAKEIRGVMALSGVYTITPNIRIFDDQFGTDAEICRAASPLNHVGKNHPPFLILYADSDFPTIDKMSEDFCKKLADGQCEAKAIKVDSRNHFTIIVQLALNSDDPSTSAMLDFIAKHSEWKRSTK
jgi:dipeptidyl aminopeptidase/acylaminoacyl peptidase